MPSSFTVSSPLAGRFFQSSGLGRPATSTPMSGSQSASFPPHTNQVAHAQQAVVGQLNDLVINQHTTDLHQLLLYSAFALVILAILSVVVGWWTAGRILQPLRTITTTVRDISATNLHERLGLDGPEDELKELGDTFDELLARLEHSFDAQRQFVANASHELRTPLATMRTALDVAIGKPGTIPEQTVQLADRLRLELDEVDELLESFLILARLQSGSPADDVVVSLEILVEAAREENADAIADLNLDFSEHHDAQALVSGNEVLLARMVENVIANAVQHNEPGGWVQVRSELESGTARLVVENAGPVLSEDAVRDLAQPFRRLSADRTRSDGGVGLGLSIVASIVELHGGRLELHALADGGFQVIIELPHADPTTKSS
jgi:signal transduction histidine kinase